MQIIIIGPEPPGIELIKAIHSLSVPAVIIVQDNLQSLERLPPRPEPPPFIIEALLKYEEPILVSPKASYITGKTLPRKKKRK